MTIVHVTSIGHGAIEGWTSPAGATVPVVGDTVEAAGKDWTVTRRIIRQQGREVTLVVVGPDTP